MQKRRQAQAQTLVGIVIPARYASSRFPGKPLAKIAGVPMIERVYKQSALSKLASRVIVATDDQRIFDCVIGFGGECVMTRSDHPTGTDRLAEVATLLPELDIIVNVQGDEPLIDPDFIDSAIAPLLDCDATEMSTIASPCRTQEELESPQIPKVAVGIDGNALYFSRYPIPYVRDTKPQPGDHLAHAGLYVYTRECLLKLSKLPPTPLETKECLEQLRALENGIKIQVVVVRGRTPAVDVPEDVAKVEKLCFEGIVPQQTVSTSGLR